MTDTLTTTADILIDILDAKMASDPALAYDPAAPETALAAFYPDAHMLRLTCEALGLAVGTPMDQLLDTVRTEQAIRQATNAALERLRARLPDGALLGYMGIVETAERLLADVPIDALYALEKALGASRPWSPKALIAQATEALRAQPSIASTLLRLAEQGDAAALTDKLRPKFDQLRSVLPPATPPGDEALLNTAIDRLLSAAFWRNEFQEEALDAALETLAEALPTADGARTDAELVTQAAQAVRQKAIRDRDEDALLAALDSMEAAFPTSANEYEAQVKATTAYLKALRSVARPAAIEERLQVALDALEDLLPGGALDDAALAEQAVVRLKEAAPPVIRPSTRIALYDALDSHPQEELNVVIDGVIAALARERAALTQVDSLLDTLETFFGDGNTLLVGFIRSHLATLRRPPTARDGDPEFYDGPLPF